MSSPEGSTVTFRGVSLSALRPRIRKFALVLQAEVAKGRPFDCLITTDAELRRLNREFRGKDYATDVLSFPSGAASGAAAPDPRPPAPGPHLGDLAISRERARAQAREIGHSTEQEICILMLHGVLHLTGLDHEADDGKMARAEARYRRRLGLPSGLIERAAV
jgi:probable rRNA maturation factor